ncbi:MAG TPA: tetratricopeptide repeat protein, partial [Spirochaetales bacterium]|nr:tetratricopeptide repeat protein [Spirochaetales bacterium]
APAPTAPASAALTDPEALLRLARDELDAKRVQSAIEALDRYLSLYPYGGDEAYYLYALACEQDTPFRDIKRSYEYYKRVRDQYPRSPRWKAAAERVAYLERHYFGLR